MAGRQPSVAVTRTTPHGLFSTQRFVAPLLAAAPSVPIGLLFSLGFQGEAWAYVIMLIGFGLLTSLDLSAGRVRFALGSIVALLALFYGVENSVIGQALSPSSAGEWSIILVSLPPSIAVLLSGVLLSRKTKYKMLKANLLASVATGIGLGAGYSMRAGLNPPLDSIFFLTGMFILLGFGASLVQTVLFHYLDGFWKAKKYSMAMMPTGFFAYNSIAVAALFISRDASQVYPFISSIGFLPALAFAGMGAYGLAEKIMVRRPSARPTETVSVSVTGDRLVQQGHSQTIKVGTESSGRPKDMATISGTVVTPTGSREPVKLSHVSVGRYTASYQPGRPGSYSVQIIATNKERTTSRESFSFSVQSPPPRYPSPTPTVPPPQSRPQPRPTVPPPRPAAPSYHPIPPSQRPTVPASRSNLPRLDNWDPKVWVNREVHGYTIKEHLATGATGYVLRATFGQAGTEMALKIPILHTGAGASALEETMSEATRLLELSGQSKYVVQIRGILVDRLNVQEIAKGDTALYLQSPPAIIMEFMKGGTAKRLIEDSSYDPLYYSEKWGTVVIMIGNMIATALDTIHKAGFVHLDVKPQNILFNAKPPMTGQDMLDQLSSGSLLPKLADLGSAVKTSGKVIQFTSEYAPVEQVLGSSAAPAMDVYALGAMIYNMLTKTPVHSKKLIDMMNNMTNNQGSSRVANDLKSTWNSFTADFAKVDSRFSSAIPVMKEMLAKDPARRPTAGAIASSLKNLGDKRGRL